MSIFNFWKNNSKEPSKANGHLGATIEEGLPEIPEKIFIEKDVPADERKVETADIAAVDNNIDLLFKFLDKNYEEQGYNDALTNPDMLHLEQNVFALKNNLQRTIRKVKTFYEDFIKEINFHIDSRGRSGMVDTVEELRMKKEIAESHISKVIEIENGAANNTGESQGIIISYTRGFKNGLAAISHHSIMKKKF